MKTDSPLFFSGLSTRGRKKMGGVYTFHDQCGFPVDMTFEMCRENGLEVDWIEFLLTAAEKGRFDEGLKEMQALATPEIAEECLAGFRWGCAEFGNSLERFREYQNQKKEKWYERDEDKN